MAKTSRPMWGAAIRMMIGSLLGVLGFGTLSEGFVNLNGQTMLIGAASILVGTFLALGVLGPLRRRRSS